MVGNLRRRSMLNEPSESASGYLYHLIAYDGAYISGYYVSATEEGHITFRNPSRVTGNKNINFRDVNLYRSTRACPTWFTLKAGQEVTFTCDPYISTFQPSLYVADSATAYKTLSSKSLTFVVEEDVDIGCVGTNTRSSVEAGNTHEMDVALYVDGVRYF